MSFNLRGLTTTIKRIQTKCFIQDLHKPLDILSGQEYKIRRENLGWLNGIWPQAEIIANPAVDGRPARRNNCVPMGKGGIFLAIGPRLKASIIDKGFVPSGSTIWVHLDHPTLGKLGVLVVYAPNHRREGLTCGMNLPII